MSFVFSLKLFQKFNKADNLVIQQWNADDRNNKYDSIQNVIL